MRSFLLQKPHFLYSTEVSKLETKFMFEQYSKQRRNGDNKSNRSVHGIGIALIFFLLDLPALHSLSYHRHFLLSRRGQELGQCRLLQMLPQQRKA